VRTIALCAVPAVVFAAWVVAFIRTFRLDSSDTQGKQ
jgi:hypothetical protein